jgi:hypothetical protein
VFAAAEVAIPADAHSGQRFAATQALHSVVPRLIIGKKYEKFPEKTQLFGSLSRYRPAG